MNPVRLLIVDDHQLFREGLRLLCERLGGFSVVAEAATSAEAVQAALSTEVDVTLMDILMPDMSGIEAIRAIIAEQPGARIIALTMERQERYMLDAVRAGARGYLLKTVDSATLIAAIEAVHRGEYLIDPVIAARVMSELHLPQDSLGTPDALSEAEMAVLRLVAEGYENDDIAGLLNYSAHTVANRMRTIFTKLRVNNRTQAALYALRQGWVALDSPQI